MKIHIPNSAFLGNIDTFISHFDPQNIEELYVTSNQRWLSVHPIVVSMIIALNQEVTSKQGTVKAQDFNAKSKAYLLRMGLISELNPQHGIVIDEHESTGRFIPARRITTSDELNQFITDMVPLLHTSTEQAYPIKYVMSELARNVLEHSQSSFGAVVCAQYFKKSNRISIGIADRGIGIKQAINFSYSARTHEEAISLALRPGITGTTKRIGGTEFNAGAGLFFTKSIAAVSRDFFLIYSGDTFFKLLKTPSSKSISLNPSPYDDRANFKSKLPFWQGTAVGIDISMDVNQDFQALLEMIRGAYHLNVKRLKNAKYKKPKFI
jgi:anti-sigma regulatory factor (Ser/Thr protein kinase)